MAKEYFGTDGVHGEVGRFPITPDFILELGYATGQVLVQHDSGHRPTVLTGRDTRISGYMLEAALVVGFTSAGVNVIQTGPLSTSDVVYLTRVLCPSAGVVISASYNVYSDNGIKFFVEGGAKLSDEIELETEAKIGEETKIQPPDRLGRVRRINSADDRYIEFCKSTLPNRPDLHGSKLVVDTTNGAGYHIVPKVLHELGAQVISIGDESNGYNINEKCDVIHPKTLQVAALQNEADYGLALDGDGNRLVMADHNSKVYDGDSLIYAIVETRVLGDIEIGGVIGTVMINMAMGIAFKEQGVQLCRAKVSDRYMLEQLHQCGWLIGGEASSHILCMNKHNIGDGTISALQVLVTLRISGQDLTIVCADWQPYPQTMINACIQRGQKWQEASVGALAGVEKELEGCSRVVLRTSGTEPVMRVMVEAKQTDWAKKDAERIAAAIQGSKK